MNWFEKIEAECLRRGAPDGWQVVRSELLGSHPNYTHHQFTGAVYPPITRGARKGRPNYRRPVNGTHRVFILSNDEVRALDAP